jgi:hypothetical protein
MKFQPGQSGNPAGRPLGARNKKTIAMEEELAEHAKEAVEIIMRRVRGGDPTCLRLLMARIMPTGTDRPLALELPEVRCAKDAQQALNMVIEAFGRGAITVREFPTMLGSVDRMARVAQRIETMRAEEHERYSKQRVHGVHPDMIPKAPPGWTDPMESYLAAIARGEDPDADDPAPPADDLSGENLYSPVNLEDEAPSLPGAAGDGEPGGGLSQARDLEMSDRSKSDRLHSSVSSEDEPAGASPPPGAADAAPPSPCGGGINEGETLHSPVNSGPEFPSENRPALPDGSRLVASLTKADGGRDPLYLDPEALRGPDPFAEVTRMVESMASGAEPPILNPE